MRRPSLLATPFDTLRRLLRNRFGRQHLAQVPESDIYGRMFASFYDVQLRRGASLHAAAEAFSGAVDALIADDRYFYDLVVLAKDGRRVRVRDRKGREFDVVDLVNNSYNDLEWIDDNREALARFVHDAPLSSCISRKIAGLHAVHDALRQEVADFLGYETCVLGTNGYIAQLSTIFALFHEGDVIFSDEHDHSSLADGCRLSKARVIPFPHGDYDALEALLRRHRRSYNGAGVVSDGVFSTKGSVADVNRLVELARRYDCLSVVDDTHGTFVLGPNGRGVLDLFDARPDVLTGGFGKGLGSFGGFAVCNRSLGAVIDILGRQNVNSSFLSPLVAAQALIHLRYYRDHHDALAGELDRKVRAFNAALGEVGLACYREAEALVHPVFCFYRDRELETLDRQRHLIDAGFLPSFFPPPVAPAPSLRFSLHRCLEEADLLRLAAELGQLGLRVEPGGRLGERRPRAAASTLALPPTREPSRLAARAALVEPRGATPTPDGSGLARARRAAPQV